ncbi:MAG: ArsR family transcriptional regulator [Phycisphaerae bacterium]|nr:ArsR family transcriptional regulator [Phycisphaerae bacterium]NUQ48687.1 ArsR family transcriptional regulator [Phycisphaerae bacterium]
MGGYWGISRTMAEIHALLFVSARPLCTDDVMDQLKISRGNASMNLRALVDWGLIDRVHQLGDRKEYFRADTDVWHMFETIMRQRRRREVEPVFATLERCCEMVRAPQGAPGGDDPHEAAEFLQRLDDLRRFLTSMGRLFELVLLVGPKGVEGLAAAMTPPPGTRPRRTRTRAAGRP